MRIGTDITPFSTGTTPVILKMADIRRVGDAGVHTVEGNVAGFKAVKLTKQRDAQKAEYEAVKSKIKEDNAAVIGKIDDKFSAALDTQEQEFRRKTVGLVTAGDFRKAREEANESRAEQLKAERAAQEKQQQENKTEARDLKRKKIASSLSFEMDEGAGDEEEDITSLLKAKKRLKDPTVDTSYLPDRERDRELNEKREALQKEWLAQQEVIKNEVWPAAVRAR
jgi:protein FAM50